MANTSFRTVLETLQNESKDFPKKFYSLFSDMDTASIDALLEIWGRIPRSRKLLLLNGLLSVYEEDSLTSFDELAHTLISDPDAEIRANSVKLLHYAHDLRTARALINILQRDPDQTVRSEAAQELGKFVLLGELEELPEDIFHKAEEILLKNAAADENTSELRRHSLEAIGYSSRIEAETLIESSFQREDPLWKASALFAMARSSNPERWGDTVMSMLLNDDERIRLEAVHAAGELDLKEARQILINMLAEDEDDPKILRAAIWSLSQIGGEDVRTYLEDIASRAEDDDMLDFIEQALENLDVNEDLEKFDLFAFDDLDELDSLEEFDEDDEEKDNKNKNDDDSKPKGKGKKKK